jgi:hypothetical protein
MDMMTTGVWRHRLVGFTATLMTHLYTKSSSLDQSTVIMGRAALSDKKKGWARAVLREDRVQAAIAAMKKE